MYVSYTLSSLVGWRCFSFEKCIRNGFKREHVVFQDGEEGTVPSVSRVGSFKSQNQCIKARQNKMDRRQITVLSNTKTPLQGCVVFTHMSWVYCSAASLLVFHVELCSSEVKQYTFTKTKNKPLIHVNTFFFRY